MAATCDATGMAVTYFTESSREDENLSLIQDLFTWLLLRYNLDIEIIHSDNELNRIKTKKWFIDVDISFEPCVFQTTARACFIGIVEMMNERLGPHKDFSNLRDGWAMMCDFDEFTEG